MLTACVSGSGGSDLREPIIFSADYYILKRPSNSDYKKLQKFMNEAPTASVADSAALVLGYYYLRDGKLEQAKPLIEDNYQSTAIEPYLSRLGELWMMELALAEERLDDALEFANGVKALQEKAGTDDALSMYCTIMKIYPERGETAYNCVNQRLAEFGIGLKSAAFDIEPLSGDLNILVTGTGNMLDKAGGIYYYMKQQGLHHKVKIARAYTDGEWDFWLDLDRGYLNGHGISLYFKSDMAFYIERIPYYLPMKSCENLVIGVNNRYRPQATDLKAVLEESGDIKVDIVDIGDASVARRLRNLLGPMVQKPFCAIGVGNEAELNNFVPTVRQYAERPATQRIYTVVDLDTGGHYVQPYLPYYGNSYVFPLIDINVSPEGKDFSESYRQYSGKDPVEEVFLGYDMMHFIHTKTNEGKDNTAPYISNIKIFHTERVVRALRLFHITSSGNIDKVLQELDETALYKENIPEDDAEMGIGGEE